MLASDPGSQFDGAQALETVAAEPTLDPADWSAFRATAHASLDRAIDLIAGVADRPVWRPVPDAVKSALAEPVPRHSQSTETVAHEMARLIMPYATGNTHPRFFGWVHGAGTAGGIIAELTAAAMNGNVGGRDHAAVYVERQVIDWSRQFFGLPDGASGLLVAGTSMATVIGLTVARNERARRSEGVDLRRSGVRAMAHDLVGYTSAEAHSANAKAFELLGLGRESLRAIPTDAEHQMDVAALSMAIASDRAAGKQPFCVVATVGTVNTGAIDPLNAIADLCARENLWLHIDGAFGALIVLAPELAERAAGIERADSIAFDFHKWLHVPYDAGCILVRDGALQQAAFSTRPAYLAGNERGLAAGEPWACEFGPDLSRGFRALKVWFTLKEHGTARLGAMIAKNCRQAAHLAELVRSTPLLEQMGPANLNIVCFRYAPTGRAPDQLDQLNADIVAELQIRGLAAPSTTRFGGRLAIRVNLTNHRTQDADLHHLIHHILALGEEFDALASPAG